MLTAPLRAQSPDQVLVVVNRRSAASREIGQYYIRKRGVPLDNLCSIDTAAEETIGRPVYEKEIEGPVGTFLTSHSLREKILYIVLTTGVPLRITGGGGGLKSEASSVDSELTLLYTRMRGVAVPLPGPVNNPFFRQRDTPFRHPLFPMYLVTRLDGYSMADMKALVDRALLARNNGKFVIDLKLRETNPGNEWLRMRGDGGIADRRGRVDGYREVLSIAVIAMRPGDRTIPTASGGFCIWDGCRARLRRSTCPSTAALSGSRRRSGRLATGKTSRPGSGMRRSL